MESARTRTYVRPALAKREHLSKVIAGEPPIVSDGTPGGKGGCFKAPQSGEPATPRKRT